MYTLFKKHTNRFIGTDKDSTKSSNFIMRYQDQLVQNANKSTAKMSNGCLVFALSLFVIVTVSINVCIVLKSYSNTTCKTVPMNFISKPVDVLEKSLNIRMNRIRPALRESLIFIKN